MMKHMNRRQLLLGGIASGALFATERANSGSLTLLGVGGPPASGGGPALSLDFATGTYSTPITVSRQGSGRFYTNSSGNLAFAGPTTLAVDYAYGSGSPAVRGLLVEPPDCNYATQDPGVVPQTATNITWTAGPIASGVGHVAGPDGITGSAGTLLLPNTTSNQHYLRNYVSVSHVSQNIAWAIVKSTDLTNAPYCVVGVSDTTGVATGNRVLINFNMATGAASATTDVFTWTLNGSGAFQYGTSGWWFCWVGFTNTNNVTGLVISPQPGSTGKAGTAYAWGGTALSGGVLVWGYGVSQGYNTSRGPMSPNPGGLNFNLAGSEPTALNPTNDWFENTAGVQSSHGGASYAVNDLFTTNPAFNQSPGNWKVTAVSSGAVTTFAHNPSASGNYAPWAAQNNTVVPTSPIGTYAVTGSGDNNLQLKMYINAARWADLYTFAIPGGVDCLKITLEDTSVIYNYVTAGETYSIPTHIGWTPLTAPGSVQPEPLRVNNIVSTTAPGTPVYLLWSTDLANSADDQAALVLGCSQATLGNVQLLGVTVNCLGSASPYSAGCAATYLSHFGFSGVPVGAYQGNNQSLLGGSTGAYAPVISSWFAGLATGSVPDYTTYPDAVNVCRAALAAAPDHSVTWGFCGFGCDINAVIQSDALNAPVPFTGSVTTTTASWTGYISGTSLYITAGSPTIVANGTMTVTGAGVAAGTLITGGSSSPYTINISQTVASVGSPESMSGSYSTLTVTSGSAGAPAIATGLWITCPTQVTFVPCSVMGISSGTYGASGTSYTLATTQPSNFSSTTFYCGTGVSDTINLTGAQLILNKVKKFVIGAGYENGGSAEFNLEYDPMDWYAALNIGLNTGVTITGSYLSGGVGGGGLPTIPIIGPGVSLGLGVELNVPGTYNHSDPFTSIIGYLDYIALGADMVTMAIATEQYTSYFDNFFTAAAGVTGSNGVISTISGTNVLDRTSAANWTYLTYSGGTLASTVFTETGSNTFALNETFQIGNNTFKFVSPLDSTPGHILRSGVWATDAARLVAAIMYSAAGSSSGAGTNFIKPTYVPNVTAVLSGSTITFTAISPGNAFYSTSYFPTYWNTQPAVYTGSAGTFTGGLTNTTLLGGSGDFSALDTLLNGEFVKVV